jgi:cyclopropane fatty-acyl-phospholipid synthase-like methyltransferase
VTNRRTGNAWEGAYSRGWAPWDVGHPQPSIVALADAGDITSPVLDSGCGTGEHALLFASRGLTAVGVDIASTAIAQAKEKAAERGLDVQFEVGDVLALDKLGKRFRTIVDSGVFHVFDDAARVRYVDSLASAIEDDGVLHLLCFSERTPGEDGPRRVTQAELRDAFKNGWAIERIEETRFDVRPDLAGDVPYAWLARIVRRSRA